MTLELYHGAEQVVDLATGQVLNLQEATLDELAETRDALTQLWRERKTAAAMVDAELVRRADEALASGEEFGHGERFRVYVDRGSAGAPDADALREELLTLALEGRIPLQPEGVRRLFSVLRYKLDTPRWNNAVKLWGGLAEIADRHRKPRRREARVTRRPDVVEGTAAEAARPALAGGSTGNRYWGD